MHTSDPPGEAVRTVTLSILPVRPAGERYEIGEAIGRGGMAVVYAATDRASGRKVALKRLLISSDAPRQRRNAALFEREYQTLAQLSHPCIVKAYDYGIDLESAYYTMELVDGADLQKLSPLPWRQAVALARDCCSALAFIHSRRLVHRDISPRNLRMTENGRGKLLDFGALAPFGLSKLIVGTPPCCAPEVVQLQPLDGRADIYALGAVLYYTLVGQHAYPARNFSMLSQLWQGMPAPPSQLVPEIPTELDALVLDLLRLDPDARPASAAEVLQRLSAIDGESAGDEAYAAQAYLATPPLVGREDAIARARRKLKRSMHGHPHAVVVDGASGLGRSRLLGACLLEATLLGVCVARADADDALHGEYGVLRALIRQLAAAMPQQATAAAVAHGALLAGVFPELGSPTESSPDTGAGPDNHTFQNAIREWFTSMSQHAPLLLAVDDFHRIDEPSAALLTLLATQGKGALCLIASLVSGSNSASNPAQKLLLERASRVSLEPLSLPHSESLLKSLFGDVANLAGLARRLQQITAGNPRDLLRLAEHLVDSGLARYEAGAWTLPARIEQVELPSSMEQALRSKLDSLPGGALTLAAGLALCADRVFSLEECGMLQVSSEASLRRDLDALLQAGVVRATEDRFGLAEPVWAELLAERTARALAMLLHARLAMILARRGEPFRAGQHWLRAGDAERGLDVLVEHARVSQEETARDNAMFIRYARSLPADWLETIDEAIGLCERLGRPRRDAFMLRGRLIGLVSAFGVSDLGHMDVLLQQLKHDSGLADFDALDSSLVPQARIRRALEQAAARYASTSEHQRVFEPKHAMTVLIRAISATGSRVRASLDVSYLRAVPSVTALVPAVPGFAALAELREGLEARYTGRIEPALETYQKLLQTLNEPGHGLEPSYALGTYRPVLNGVGQLEAYMGLPACLERAASLEQQATTGRRDAVQIRALYHLFQGDARASDECKKELELLRVETMQLYEGSSLLFEITAHCIAEDMTRMRQVVEELRPLTEKYSAWRAVAHFGAAEYQRMRKAPDRAAIEIAHGLELAQPGVHPLWAYLATAHVRSVAKLESAHAALALARAYAAKAHEVGLGCSAECLRAELAICEALTDCESAQRSADAVIERMLARGMSGLLLGFAYETRAHVALLCNDLSGCESFLQRCEQIYLKHKNAALRSKCERLRRMANPSGKRGASPGPGASDTTLTGTRVVAALESCQAEQRGRLTLTLLAAASGSRAGFLFTLEADGLQCTAAVGNLQLPPGLMQHVIDYVEAQREHEDDTTQSRSLADENIVLEWQDLAGRRYRPVLLSHAVQDNLRIVGVAVLEVPQGQAFKYPADTALAVSRFWVDSANSLLISSE